MKLYIWVDPVYISYGHSTLMAVAASENEAKELINQELKRKEANAERSVLGLKHPNSKIKLGSPTTVYELPCAILHVWEE